MLAKKFFINSGITVKTNNGSYYRLRNHPPHYYAPLQFSVFLTHWGDKRSPFLRLTNLLPSDPNKLNLDSSLKWTIFHCSSVHRICSAAKSRRTVRFFFEIKGLWHWIRATNFSLFNLRERFFFLESGFTVCSQNAQEIVVAVSKQSFKDILTIIRPSRLVVIRGLLVFGFGSRVLSALKQRFLTFVRCQQFQYMICLLPDLLKWPFFPSWVKQLRAFPSIFLKNSPNDVWQLTINQNKRSSCLKIT